MIADFLKQSFKIMNFNYICVPGNHFKPLKGEEWTRHIEKEKCSLQYVAFSLCV